MLRAAVGHVVEAPVEVERVELLEVVEVAVVVGVAVEDVVVDAAEDVAETKKTM